MTETANSPDESKPFIAHLDDLRGAIIRGTLALAAGMAIAIPSAPWLFGVLKQPLVRAGMSPDTFLTVLSVAGGFGIAARLIFWSGLILSLPAVLYFIAGFVFPGLTAIERRVVRRSVGFAAGLFAAGVLLGYLIMPPTLLMMLGVNEWLGTPCTVWETGSYVAFVLRLMLVFGLAFELPVVLYALAVIGIVRAAWLRTYRRHVVVGLLAFAMLVTPQDPLTMLMLGLPLIGLYEICIGLIAARERREGRASGS